MEMTRAANSGLEIKSVFGPSRTRRWKSFQNIFRRHCASHYPQRLLTDAEKRTDLKYRILKEGAYDVGILIYQPATSRARCFKVELLHVRKRDNYAGFIQEILKLAKQEDADRVSIAVSAKDQTAIEELGRVRVFREEEKDGNDRIFVHQFREVETVPKGGKGNGRMGKREREGNVGLPSSIKRAKPEKVDRCPIKRKYFNFIRSGRKTVEGRIKSHPFTQWQAGQTVDFFCGSDSVRCRVDAINTYRSFSEMLEAEGVANCLPDVRTVSEGARVYDRIPRYAEKARKFGVLGIRITRI